MNNLTQGKVACTYCKAIWTAWSLATRAMHTLHLHDHIAATLQVPNHKSTNGSRDCLETDDHLTCITKQPCLIRGISGSHQATNHFTFLNRGHPAKSWSMERQPRLHKATNHLAILFCSNPERIWCTCNFWAGNTVFTILEWYSFLEDSSSLQYFFYHIHFPKE